MSEFPAGAGDMRRRGKLVWRTGGSAMSVKRVPAAEAAEVERLYRERYTGFTAKHFHEHLVERHGFRWGYSWTKTYLQNRGHIKKAPRRWLHQDGSRHSDLDQPLDLIVTLDDATGAI